MNKKTIWIAVALVLVVALLAGVYFATRPDTNTDMKSFTVTVVHKDGATKDIALESDKEYLGECLQEKGIVKGTDGQYGLFVEEVDGATLEDANAFWSITVNDEEALVGISSIPLEDGAVYKLAYTIWTE